MRYLQVLSARAFNYCTKQAQRLIHVAASRAPEGSPIAVSVSKPAAEQCAASGRSPWCLSMPLHADLLRPTPCSNLHRRPLASAPWRAKSSKPPVKQAAQSTSNDAAAATQRRPKAATTQVGYERQDVNDTHDQQQQRRLAALAESAGALAGMYASLITVDEIHA